jgi:hypothetical protein
MDLHQNVDQDVTLTGKAETARMGAMVTVDVNGKKRPVYIDGLDRWDSQYDGKDVEVKGTLRFEQPDDVVDQAGNYSTGVPAGRFVLESATWDLA